MSYELVVIGGGRMGSALVEGLLKANWCDPAALAVVESAAEQRASLQSRFDAVSVVASLELDHVGPGTGVVLCVKPDHAEGAARLAAACGATVSSCAAATARPRAARSRASSSGSKPVIQGSPTAATD